MSAPTTHVCMLAGGHPILDRRIFHKEARSLVKAGYSVTIIGQHSSSRPFSEAGMSLIPLPSWPRVPVVGFLHRIFSLVRLGLKNQADVFHGHDPESLLAGLFLKLWTGRKLVYDVHEIFAEAPHDLKTLLVFPGLYLVEGLLCRAADLVIAVTDPLADHVRRRGARNVITVENLALLDVLKRARPMPRSALGLKKEHIVFGYFGHMSNIMATNELINGFQEFRRREPRARLLLIGNVTDPDALTAMGNDAGIIHRPFMRYEDVLPYYSVLDVGLMNLRDIPPAYMAISTKLFEFMYYRIPVLTGDTLVQNVAIVRRAKCGLAFRWNDPRDLADKMDFLARRPGLRRRMGANARAAVIRRYHWGVAERRLLEAYRDLAPRGPSMYSKPIK